MLHEKLICYRQSLELAQELSPVLGRWPRGYGYLVDQTRRAMASVLLNTAEGNTRFGSGDRRRFFVTARASLAEIGACLDLMKVFHLISENQYQNWKGKAYAISKMLYNLK